MLCVIAGGVGAARLLAGAVRVAPPEDIVVVGNVADDVELYGLHVSPDLDTVTYTLAGAVNPETGWGLDGESWQAMTSLRRYGDPAWFNLGDRDLGTHLYRTRRLSEGATLSTVTAEITATWGVAVTLLPATDDRLRTRVTVLDPDGPPGGVEVGFQDYFVARRHSVPVTALRFDGAETATAGPGVLEAIGAAVRVVVAPSNPLVSIGPVLAVAGVRDALAARRDTVVAVSPIVAGAALKGPADRLLLELGHESSVVGVARLWRDIAATLVVDRADAALAPAVEAEGMRCVVTDTVMRTTSQAAALTEVCLGSSR